MPVYPGAFQIVTNLPRHLPGLTRWRTEEDFQAWVASADFAAGHAQNRERGPVGTASEIWSFDVLERQASGAGG